MPLSSTGFVGTYKSDHNIYDKLGGTAEGKRLVSSHTFGKLTSLLLFLERCEIRWKKK